MQSLSLHPDPDFDFAVRCLLNGAAYGMADPEAVLRAVAPVSPGGHDEWFTAVTELGTTAHAAGDASAAAGHRASARDAYLRAANYRFAGFYYVLATRDPGRWSATWSAHRASTECAFAHWDTPVVTATAALGELALPVWVFSPADPPRHSRLLVLHNGFGAPLSDAVMTAVTDGVRRGWTVVTFDGPGQGAVRVRDGVAPVADWGAVGRAVVDAALGAAHLPAATVAVMGVADGSALATLAAAGDDRVQALVCDPGVVAPVAGGLDQVPTAASAAWTAGDRDGVLAAVAAATPSERFALAKLTEAWPGFDALGVLDHLHAWDLTEVAPRISVPTIIAAPTEAMGFAGQSVELAGLLGGPVRVIEFDGGAALDCEIGAPGTRAQRIFDALDEILPRADAPEPPRSP